SGIRINVYKPRDKAKACRGARINCREKPHGINLCIHAELYALAQLSKGLVRVVTHSTAATGRALAAILGAITRAAGASTDLIFDHSTDDRCRDTRANAERPSTSAA